MQIKTIIVEEHHEAFFAWKYAIEQGLIPPRNNNLIHIDEHSDMGMPLLNQSIDHLPKELKDIKAFTYRELKIGGFIVPSIYQKIIQKVNWVKYRHDSVKREEPWYIRSLNNKGYKFMAGRVESLPTALAHMERVNFVYSKSHIEDIKPEKNILLDIDLDYFSCTGNPIEQNELSVEISEKEFINYTHNPYHHINFVGLGRIEAERRGQKYYFVINRFEKNLLPKHPALVNETEFNSRIQALVKVLKNQKIIPGFITICRSRFSGYTPHDQWKTIENNLLKELRKVYDLDIQKVQAIH